MSFDLARTLNFTTSVFAFLARVEVVSVAGAATIDKLLTNSLATVVEPFVLVVLAWTALVRQEAEVYGLFQCKYAMLIRIIYASVEKAKSIPDRNSTSGGLGVLTGLSHLFWQSCSVWKLLSLPPHPP